VTYRLRKARRRPHATAPTSRAAYAGLSHIDTQGQYRTILAALDAHPEGLTRRELAHLTGIGYEAICGRIDELLGRLDKSPYKKEPLVAELPTTRKNADTGIQAAVVVSLAAGTGSGDQAEGDTLVNVEAVKKIYPGSWFACGLHADFSIVEVASSPINCCSCPSRQTIFSVRPQPQRTSPVSPDRRVRQS